jgi:hypothetical protein
MRKLFVLVGAALASLMVVSSPAAAHSSHHGTLCNDATPQTLTVSGDLVVPENGTCTIVGSTVSRDVKVGKNAYFEADNSQIGDDVKGSRALTIYLHGGSSVGDDVTGSNTFQVFVFDSAVGDDIETKGVTDTVDLCGNTVGDDIEVTRSARDILIGDPAATDCAGNTVEDDIEVKHNSVDVELIVRGNTVGDDLEVNDNSSVANSGAQKAVEDNVGGDDLECHGNNDPFTASGNTGWDHTEGQCEIPPTECSNDASTPLTGSVPGDLVVSDNGVCYIAGATVGGNVRVGRDAYFEASGSQIAGDVKSRKSTTVFLHDGTTVGGSVESDRTFQVFLFDSAVGEDVQVEDTSGTVNVCGVQVTDDIQVEDSGRDILVGDTLGGCGGNTVGDDIEILHNRVDVELIVRGNTVTDDLKVFNNKSINGSNAPKSVDSNTGGDSLECYGNDDPFTGSPNTGFASAEGQCTSV